MSENGNADFETEDEALQVLMDGDIDKVMAGLDRIIEAAWSKAAIGLSRRRM